MPFLQATIADLRNATARDLFHMGIVFVVIILGARFGQYIYFAAQISPAIIWIPAGIGLAAVLLGGYRMWVPIALATLLSALTSIGEIPFLTIIFSVVAQTIQPLVGTYLLERWGFDRTFEDHVDVIYFTFAAMLMSAVTPTAVTLASLLSGSLADSAYLNWSRIWAGHVLSIVVLTPFLLTWVRRSSSIVGKQFFERLTVFLLLLITIYFLFWTNIAQGLSFLILFVHFIPLFWIALRLNFRFMTLAIFLVAAFGIAGAIVADIPRPLPLNQRLLSIELYLILIAPIFYLFASLAKERRVALAISTRRSQELESALHRLEEQDRQKDEFISTLAHELRNPLAALLHSLELMQLQGLHTSGARDSMGVALRQTGQIERMLASLLDVSRATQGKIVLELKNVPVSKLINQAVETIAPQIEAGRQNFKVDMQKDFKLTCDPLRIEQILVNLIANSVKYTEPGGYITLSVFREGEEAVFRVRDTGKGIAPEMLDSIFDLFVQANQAFSIQGGLGIGLTLSRTLARLHGGTLTAASSGIGKGSEFVLRIPIHPRHPVQDGGHQ